LRGGGEGGSVAAVSVFRSDRQEEKEGREGDIAEAASSSIKEVYRLSAFVLKRGGEGGRATKSQQATHRGLIAKGVRMRLNPVVGREKKKRGKEIARKFFLSPRSGRAVRQQGKRKKENGSGRC